MNRTIAALACLCLSLVLTPHNFAQTRERRVGQTPQPPAAPAQTPQTVGEDEVVRVETTLVTIPVSVTDRAGRYIPDLRREDFQLYEDGVEQEIAYFAAVEKPFTVVLMLDTSASVWKKLGRIKAAANAFVAQLRPDDQVMVTTFATGLTIKCDATTDRAQITKAINGAGKGMNTHIYDALDAVMLKQLRRIEGRKAIVLFTDGVDSTSSHKSYEDNFRVAEELDALIYPIRYDTFSDNDDTVSVGTPTPQPPMGRSRLPGILGRLPLPIPGGTIGTGSGGGASRGEYAWGQHYLQELARLTGGRYYEASQDLHDLDIAFTHIADELRRQYSLGYYPKAHGRAGERRRVRVRVHKADLAVRARDSYIYQPAPNADATAQDQKTKPKNAPVLKKPLIADAKQ